MHRLVCAFVALVAFGIPARAETPAPAVAWDATALPDVKPVQVKLTADSVQRLVDSLPELIAFARELDGDQGRSDQLRVEDNLAFLLVPHLFDSKVEARINGKLAAYGFASYAEWANVAHSVSIAMEAAEFTGAVDLGNQEQAARREIEADTKLSAGEKAKALDELASQFAALAEFEPLPGNREVVEPYLDRLRAIAAPAPL